MRKCHSSVDQHLTFVVEQPNCGISKLIIGVLNTVLVFIPGNIPCHFFYNCYSQLGTPQRVMPRSRVNKSNQTFAETSRACLYWVSPVTVRLGRAYIIDDWTLMLICVTYLQAVQRTPDAQHATKINSSRNASPVRLPASALIRTCRSASSFSKTWAEAQLAPPPRKPL